MPESREARTRLVNNLKNTEVDIVLETHDRIFIGEAKCESDLGADSELVLVHQLIRQYVATRILIHLTGYEKGDHPICCGRKKQAGQHEAAQEAGPVHEKTRVALRTERALLE